MKIVVVGGSGLIGSQVVAGLSGHEVVAASPKSGFDAVTGQGLSVLDGADVVVDVSNSPSFADDDRAGTANLVAAGPPHLVALSVVGCDRLPDSGYLRAKVEQERLIRESGVAYSIVRATQFFEFVGAIAKTALVDGVVRLPAAKFQPMASADVAAAVVDVVLGEPLNGVREVGGPEVFGMADLAREVETHPVVVDPAAKYFGTEVPGDELLPGPDGVLYPTRFADWRGRQDT
jgi:uncharacterized protein YbjT (DUF2867 family)